MPRGDICKIEQVFPIRPITSPGEDQQQEIVETGKPMPRFASAPPGAFGPAPAVPAFSNG
jgi:hypothetical protein